MTPFRSVQGALAAQLACERPSARLSALYKRQVAPYDSYAILTNGVSLWHTMYLF